MRNAGYTQDCACGPEIGYIRGGHKHINGDVPFPVFKEAVDRIDAELGRLRTEHDVDIAAVNARLNNYIKDLATAEANIGVLTKSISDLEARVTALEQGEPVPPEPAEIISFTITPKTGEIGKTVTVVATWEIKGAVKTATINGENVKGVNTKTFSATQTTEYKLIVTDESGNTVQKAVKINFANYIYWGTSQSETATEADIKALSNKQLTDTVSRSLGTIHCGSGAYIYYAYPKRLGNIRITQYGIEGGFDLQGEITANSETYKVYRSSYYLDGDVDEIQISSVT